MGDDYNERRAQYSNVKIPIRIETEYPNNVLFNAQADNAGQLNHDGSEKSDI
jgi:hypothetical protein